MNTNWSVLVGFLINVKSRSLYPTITAFGTHYRFFFCCFLLLLLLFASHRSRSEFKLHRKTNVSFSDCIIFDVLFACNNNQNNNYVNFYAYDDISRKTIVIMAVVILSCGVFFLAQRALYGDQCARQPSPSSERHNCN